MGIKRGLNPQGFITNWLLSGPATSRFIDDKVESDQLKYEKYLRSIIADKGAKRPEDEIKLNQNSEVGHPWRYYFANENWFVDVGTFYSLLTKIDLLASVYLYCEEDMEVSGTLWTYAAIDLWLGEEYICQVPEPVYKPITKKDIYLKLKKGENRLLVKMQNLGVRDTRNQFGIQINENIDMIEVRLPDAENVVPFIALDYWLSQIEYKNSKLIFGEKPPQEINITLEGETIKIAEETEFAIPSSIKNVEVFGMIDDQKLSRKIDIIENIIPVYGSTVFREENNQLIVRRIANIERMPRGNGVYFAIFNVLARYAINEVTEKDRQFIFDTLDLIESRIDCSDFLVAGLLRLVREYTLDQDILDRVREVLLDYRYWMDEKGSDGMCFWSENHALMFYGSALIASEMYPDEIFIRSGKTGKELYEVAKKRCEEWLSDVEKDGYEEFISAGYMCVTFGALLNLIDYGEESISLRAKKLTDQLLETLALHTFKGSVIGPQGRVYRDVVLPFTQGVQALINMIQPSMPYAVNEWLAVIATTKYEIPENLPTLMDGSVDTQYETGNALIKLKKEDHYILTSAQSPREDRDTPKWENISFLQEVNKDSYHYTKSLNERYHGTTNFLPGIYGYQQHMWYGALSNDCVIFTNHPGGTYDGSTMRPGYWYGNGILPAIKQQGQVVGAIYSISQDHPIPFTHLFWPNPKFDQVIRDQNWLFGRKAGGYIAIWSSGEMVPHNDQLFDCEYRVYQRNNAYLCCCASEVEVQNFDNFMKECKALMPTFNKKQLTLTTSADFSLQFQKYEDKSQYV